MNLPFTLPDWLPWWAPILLLVPALLWALAFLFMPFSVIGLKGRLEAMEAQLEELHSELRGLAHRLPEPMRQSAYDEVYAPPGTAAPRQEQAPVITRPPIPPAAYDLDGDDSARTPHGRTPQRCRPRAARRAAAGLAALSGAGTSCPASGVDVLPPALMSCLRRAGSA